MNNRSDNKNIKINVVCTAIVKIVALVINLAMTPAYMDYFDNQESLGVWYTVLSMITWILACDMGIGNGLRNKLTEAIAKRDKIMQKRYISSAYIFMFGNAGGILLILIVMVRIVDWNRVLNIDDSIISNQDLKKIIIILIASIILQFVLRLITSICYALQQSFLPGFFALCTSVIMCIYVMASNKLGYFHNDLYALSWNYFIASNLPLFIATVMIFGIKLKDVRPSINYFSREYAFDTLKLGGAFLWLQLMAFLLGNTDNYLVELLFGNAFVVEYQLYFKVFTLANAAIAMLMTPMWSAVTKAKSENNYEWLKKSYKITKIIGLIFIIGELCIVPFTQIIFNIWLGNNTIPAKMEISITFFVLGSLMIWSNVITNIVNGLGKLKLQVITVTIGALANIPLAIVFSKMFDSYTSIIYVNIISYIPYIVLQTYALDKKILR